MLEISPERQEDLKVLSRLLGHHFHDYSLLQRALTHCSYANESGLEMADNERYEFLGDAVLELAVTHILCDHFPKMDEGDLSKIRASSVNKKTLARISHNLHLGDYLLLSKGEKLSNGEKKSSILADTFEAVVAAIYLDGGLEAAFLFVSGHFLDIFQNLSSTKMIVIDFKTRLQEVSQSRFRVTPKYSLLEEHGPDHAKEFVVGVSIKSTTYGTGRGTSKKDAEQHAARIALAALKKVGRDED